MLLKNIDNKTVFARSQLLGVILVVGVIGTIVTLISRAAGNSVISGVAFQDTNRNGIQESGEPPIVNKLIYLSDASGQTQVAVKATDTSGRYIFTGLSDATYQIEYDPTEWWTIRYDLVPTTTGSIYPKMTINLQSQATANFGWRQILRSTYPNPPISAYTAPNGTKFNSYNDAVTAQEVYSRLSQGSLFGKEAPLTTVNLDVENYISSNDVSVDGGPPWSNFISSAKISYVQYLEGDNVLFHEYGHAWSLYYAYIEAQNINFTEYLKLRGIANDSRLDTSHAWNRRELIAEDYRQLFGSIAAQQVRQENYELPAAKDVPGLKEYLSGAFMLNTADSQAPTAPTNLRATVLSQSEVKLTWTASTDNVGVTKYKITRTDPYNGQAADRYVDGTITVFTDSGLSPDVPYTYNVTAFDATNNRTASTDITVITGAPDTQVPSAPTNLTGKAASTSEGSSINLSWSASTDNVGVAKYLVYRNGTQVGYVNAPSTSFADSTGLVPGTNYQYYVKAVDAAGNTGTASTTITVNTGGLDIQAPSIPTSLSSPTQTQTSIVLKWNPSTDNIGVTGYRIYQVGGSRKNTFNTLITTTTGTGTTYTVTGLTRGTSYSYYVVAIDAAGNTSSPSNTLTVKTKR